MSTISLPEFGEREILTHQKLNAAMNAITQKFTSGVDTSQLTWPMTADGDLDMAGHRIVNGIAIWNVVNAASYDSFTDAVTAAGANSIIFIPPNTTMSVATETALPSDILIIGSGWSSKIARTSAGNMFTCSGSNIMFANLQLMGAGAGTGVACHTVSSVRFSNVRVAGFGTNGIQILGTSDDVGIHACTFASVSGNCIEVTRGTSVVINGCTFANPGDGNSVKLGTDGTVQVVVNGCTASSGAESVSMASAAGMGSSAVWVVGGHYNGAITLGSDSAHLSGACQVSNCRARSISLNATHGVVSGNTLNGTATTAIRLFRSTHVVVTGNVVRGAYTNGIDISHADCEYCLVSNNNLTGATNGIQRGNNTHATGLNIGDSVASGTVVGNTFAFAGDPDDGGSLYHHIGGVDTFALTLPDILVEGAVLTIDAFGSANRGASTGSMSIQVRVESHASPLIEITDILLGAENKWSMRSSITVMAVSGGVAKLAYTSIGSKKVGVSRYTYYAQGFYNTIPASPLKLYFHKWGHASGLGIWVSSVQVRVDFANKVVTPTDGDYYA